MSKSRRREASRSRQWSIIRVADTARAGESKAWDIVADEMGKGCW